MEKFLEMLTFMRPAFNPYDDAFVTRYIDVLNPNIDLFGNRWIDVGDNPDVIWSSHTDTVHNRGGFQQIVVDKHHVVRVAPKQKDSNCLGADCTTGVWLMLEMIEAGVKGRYIFHRDEERGGHGSKYIKKNTPELLRGIKAAIAFDRKGFSDVITEQGVPTASDEFAKSLAKLLGGSYKPSPWGMYTDTKEYRSIIPECTNISVGYNGAHSRGETQDLKHLKWLRDVLVQIDTDQLVIARDPSVPDPVYGYGGYSGRSFGYADRGIRMPPRTIEDLLDRYPLTTTSILEREGWTFDTLYAAIVNEITDNKNSAVGTAAVNGKAIRYAQKNRTVA